MSGPVRRPLWVANPGSGWTFKLVVALQVFAFGVALGEREFVGAVAPLFILWLVVSLNWFERTSKERS